MLKSFKSIFIPLILFLSITLFSSCATDTTITTQSIPTSYNSTIPFTTITATPGVIIPETPLFTPPPPYISGETRSEGVPTGGGYFLQDSDFYFIPISLEFIKDNGNDDLDKALYIHLRFPESWLLNPPKMFDGAIILKVPHEKFHPAYNVKDGNIEGDFPRPHLIGLPPLPKISGTSIVPPKVKINSSEQPERDLDSADYQERWVYQSDINYEFEARTNPLTITNARYVSSWVGASNVQNHLGYVTQNEVYYADLSCSLYSGGFIAEIWADAYSKK